MLVDIIITASTTDIMNGIDVNKYMDGSIIQPPEKDKNMVGIMFLGLVN